MSATSDILSRDHIDKIFVNLIQGNRDGFFSYIVEDVDWLVTGQSHPLAGRWTSKETYLREAWSRISGLLIEPMKFTIQNMVVQPESPGLKGVAVVELKGVGGVLKNGDEYNNEYCWVIQFNEAGMIEKVRAYLDTAKLRDALESNFAE